MIRSDLTQDELRSLLAEDEIEMNVVFSDTLLPDNPMIYVSEELEAIKQGLNAETRFNIDILNYRKGGPPFVNRLRIRLIYDPTGSLMYFVGAQNPVLPIRPDQSIYQPQEYRPRPTDESQRHNYQ